jgi:hypothetical protein
MLSQEVRNPMAGRFTFSVHAAGAGTSAELYREWFLKHFSCKLAIFAFLDLQKNHTQHRPFATVEFQPAWSEAGKPNYERFEVSAKLRSQDDGAGETNMGIGVGILVARKSEGPLELPAGSAFVRIDDVELVFDPRPRDDRVTV